MGWGEEYMGYTNTDNPFGDNNLLGTFIWNKVGVESCRQGGGTDSKAKLWGWSIMVRVFVSCSPLGFNPQHHTKSPQSPAKDKP